MNTVNPMESITEQTTRYCNRCKERVIKSTLEQYTYACETCDEDLFSFETHATQ